MRFGDYLVKYREKIDNYEIVEKSLLDLSRIRSNERETEDYFNNFLFADIRFLSLSENSDDFKEEDFRENKGEVSRHIAFRVRQEMLEVIYEDESFIYSQNIIILEKSCYRDHKTNTLIAPRTINGDTKSKIIKTICNYKEDYPKDHLSDYLTDDNNMEYYSLHKKKLKREIEWWLEAFNIAYKNFDILRKKAFCPCNAIKLIYNIDYDDKLFKNTVIGIIHNLFLNYNFDLSAFEKKKFGMITNMLSEFIEPNELNCIADPIESESEKYENELKKLTLEIEEIKSNKQKEISELQKKIDRQHNQIKKLTANDDDILSCSQQTIVFKYLLESYGVDLRFRPNTELARFIRPLTGRSLVNIRKYIDFEYDDETTKENLQAAANAIKELLPELADQMLRDMNA